MGNSKSQDPKASALKTRFLMALIMMPVALLFVWLGGWWFAALCLAGAIILGLEWATMAQLPRGWTVASAAAIPVVVFMVFELREAIAALWILGGLAALAQTLGPKRMLQTLIGVVYVGGISLAFLVLREGDWNGRTAALMLMGMVWASDSGAYFAGRTIGGPLLTPKNSPNKTWSGAIGAVVCTALCGVIAAWIVQMPTLRWVLFSALLSIVAQYGDLIESRIKRDFGAKDASNLLPGHGGLMDRVDGLGAVCLVSASLFIIFPQFVQYMGLGA